MKSIAMCFLLFFSSAVTAGSDICFSAAAKKINVDPDLLIAIANVESGLNPNARNVNTNGSYDLGIMQINSSHLPLLKKIGITESILLDPCTSIYVGAYILKGFIRTHGNTWRAVGAYNAGSKKSRESKRGIYVAKVYAAFKKLKLIKHKERKNA